ncbi:MAG: ATP-binding protein [Streptosporangiaceae bacterium]|nr:ATP-binding protein [Streptosporangiaceae bacterium]MBV9853301.1 ATP-binding protein [Streptosporangiaceae bacterium]
MTNDHSTSDAQSLGDAGPGEEARERWAREMALPAQRRAARLARRATRAQLAFWRVPQLEETAVLLVSELVTNSVRHAHTQGDELLLRLEITWSSLRIEVYDDDPRWPRPGTPPEFSESGFGFVLVAALASNWGVSDTATGKSVWAELDILQRP